MELELLALSGVPSEDPAVPVPKLFQLCAPSANVLAETIRESDFAADLALALRCEGPDDYRDHARFGMAMRRKNLRRVLTALRWAHTDPARHA